MGGDLVSLRILAVFASEADRNVLRQGAGTVSVPIDVLEADSANAAAGVLAGGDIDIAFLDAAIAAPEMAAIVAAARAAKPPPFVILAAASQEGIAALGSAAGADAIVVKPAAPQAAQALVERCIRVRLPSRILVVDDSSTTRSIVRKILSASRF